MPEKQPYPDDLDKRFASCAHDLARKKLEEALVRQPNQLLPQKTLLERYTKELSQEFTSYKARQVRGASKLAFALEELAKEQPELFSADVIEGINRIGNLSSLAAKDEQTIITRLENGSTLQEIAQVSDEVIETLYQAAKRLYDKKLYDDAADIFGFVIGLNPSNYAIWLGLANAQYMLGNFQEAIIALENVCKATPNDPACHLTASRCYAELGQLDKAIVALELSLAAIKESQVCLDWKSGIEQEKMHLQQMLHSIRD